MDSYQWSDSSVYVEGGEENQWNILVNLQQGWTIYNIQKKHQEEH